MADSGYGFSVEIDLKTGGFKDYNNKLGAINSSTGAVVASTARMNKGFKGMASAMLMAIAVFSVVSRAVSGLTKYVSESVDSFRDFQESITEVSTILGDMDMQLLPALQAGVESLSKSFGKSATDLANGLYNILSAAVPADDALNLLYTSTKASVAGLSDVSTSVDVMTSVLNAYGLTVEQMTHVSDVMFQSIIRGKFRFSDLASALGYVTPIAAQAGISFEELSAALATATRHGLHIDMVARGLALAIQNIIKPGEQAVQFAAQYGIELSLASLRAKGLIGYIEDLNAKTEGNAAVISKIIPNMRSYRVMMVLAGEGVEGVTKDVTLMSESLGKADTAFTKMATTAQRQTDIIVQYAEDIRRQVGESFLGLQLFMSKLDIFKGFAMTEFSKNPFEAILPGTGTLLRAAMSTKEIWDQIDKQIDKYSAKWQKDFENMLDPLVETDVNDTLFKRLKSGENVDLSKYENQADDYLNAAEKWTDAVLELEKAHSEGLDDATYQKALFQLEEEYTAVMDLYDAYTYYKSGVDDTEDAIEDHSEAIDIYVQKLGELETEIGVINNLYDGTLGHALEVAEQDKIVAEMTHYVGLAIEDEKYQVELASKGFSWYNDEVAEAIKVVRAYEQSQKAATSAQKEFNFALAENRIATMQLQLIGMMRRRGNTRSEQQKLKALQIERTQLQIESAQKELESELSKNQIIIDDKEKTYSEAKSLLDAMERDEQHYLWVVKDTRADDIINLKNQIATKETAYVELSNTVKTETELMGQAIGIYSDLVSSYYGGSIPEAVQASIDAFNKLYETQLKSAGSVTTKITNPVTKNPTAAIINDYFSETKAGKIFSKLQSGGFERGTWSVPETGLTMVHRGETIRPNGDNSGTESIVVNVNVTGNNITKESLPDTAREIGIATKQALIDSVTGKSKYRLR